MISLITKPLEWNLLRAPECEFLFGEDDFRNDPTPRPAPEPCRHKMGAWLIRMGATPDASLSVSRIGIYTDFT